jgi:hypothetical protein
VGNARAAPRPAARGDTIRRRNTPWMLPEKRFSSRAEAQA